MPDAGEHRPERPVAEAGVEAEPGPGLLVRVPLDRPDDALVAVRLDHVRLVAEEHRRRRWRDVALRKALERDPARLDPALLVDPVEQQPALQRRPIPARVGDDGQPLRVERESRPAEAIARRDAGYEDGLPADRAPP